MAAVTHEADLKAREGGDTGRDLNGVIAALLSDLAAVQKSQQSKWGYKRAASAIRNLEEAAPQGGPPIQGEFHTLNDWRY